jgi:hypothetical protein
MRASGLLLLFAVIPVLCNQLAVPTKDRFRTSNPGNLLEHRPAEDLAFDGQAPPLLFSEQDSLLPNFLPKYPIFDEEIFDHILLLTINPAGENQQQQLPGLKENLHFFLRICCEILQHPASPTASQALYWTPPARVASGSFCNDLRHGVVFSPYARK